MGIGICGCVLIFSSIIIDIFKLGWKYAIIISMLFVWGPFAWYMIITLTDILGTSSN